MPIIGKTYYCGDQGKLKVYNHGIGIWTDKSVPGVVFYDVKADPTNPNTIIVGASGDLFKSVDAGTTLVSCSGNWDPYVLTIYQISYTSNPNIIYAVGVGGIVKSIDAGASFNRLDSFSTNNGLQCLAVHFINDLVGIASKESKLFKTTDGGVSWVPLYTGNVLDPAFPNDRISSLHLSADQSTIIATTARKIFRSTDGGLGFTMVEYFGTTSASMGKSPKYTNLAWSSDNVLIASAGNGNVLYSYNAGASWINTVGMIPSPASDSKSGSNLFQGFTTSGAPVGFFSSDADESIYRLEQLDLTTFTSSLSDTYDKRVYAMTSSVANVTCYLLTPCAQTGNPITASNSELDDYVDTYVNIDGSCFYVTEAGNCNNTIQITYSSLISVDDCNACNPPEPIYALRDCIALQLTKYTTEALTPGISGVIGQVVYIAGYPNTCWIVVEQSGDAPQAVTILNDFGTCSACANQLPGPPPVYKLTNCLNDKEVLYTYNSEFAQPFELEQTVQLTEDVTNPRKCWTILQVDFDNQAISDRTIYENNEGVPQIFENCECCLPVPEPAPIKYTRVIPKPDKKYYQVKQSQCDVTGNIRFAQAYYNLFKKLKYGISAECDTLDINKLWIKKQLSDLAMTADPTACPTTPVAPIATVCPEPKGNPYVPPETLTYYYTVYSPLTCNGFCFSGTPTGYACEGFVLELDYDLFASVPIPNVTFFGFNYNGAQVWAWVPFISPCEPINTPCMNNFPLVTGITSSNISYTNIPAVEGVNPCPELFGG